MQGWGPFSAKQVVFHDRVERTEAIPPADFFALFVGAAVIADADLVDHAVEPRHLGGDLRLESEPVFFDRDLLQHLATESLVAGLHVRDVDVGGHIGEQSEKLVADHVPEIDYPVRLGANETRAKNDIGLTVEDGLDQLGIFPRVVFQIGVLDEHDVTGDGGEPGPERGALAAINLVINDLVHQRRNLRAQKVPRAISRAVVNDDDLLFRDRRGANTVDDLADRLGFVVAGDDDGKLHGRWMENVRSNSSGWILRRDAGYRAAVTSSVNGKIAYVDRNQPGAGVALGQDDERGIAPVGAGCIARDEFRGPAGADGAHRNETHQSGLQRGEQLQQGGDVRLQMMRGFSKDRFSRADRAAHRRQRFAAPSMPMIGGPEGADERAGINQIPNVRILHGRKGRSARE